MKFAEALNQYVIGEGRTREVFVPWLIFKTIYRTSTLIFKEQRTGRNVI